MSLQEGHRKRGAELQRCSYKPKNAKPCWELSEPWWSQARSLPNDTLISDLQPPELREKISVVLSNQVYGHLLQQPWETNKTSKCLFFAWKLRLPRPWGVGFIVHTYWDVTCAKCDKELMDTFQKALNKWWGLHPWRQETVCELLEVTDWL